MNPMELEQYKKRKPNNGTMHEYLKLWQKQVFKDLKTLYIVQDYCLPIATYQIPVWRWWAKRQSVCTSGYNGSIKPNSNRTKAEPVMASSPARGLIRIKNKPDGDKYSAKTWM